VLIRSNFQSCLLLHKRRI